MPDGNTLPRPSFLEQARAIVGVQTAARDANSSGVRWSGMDSEPAKVETIEVVIDRLQRAAERSAAWKQTPRGQFYTAVLDLQDAGFHEEAGKLEGFYRRSLQDERQPLNVRATAACLIILDGITAEAARTATVALHELLLETRPAMMGAA